MSMLTVVLVLLAALPQQPPATSKSNKPTTIALVGCVSGKPNAAGEFTFVEARTGSEYRLTGKGVRKYAGERVELIGGPRGKGLSIRGGLWPSPNVAAQGAAIDPAQAAVASQPGGGSLGTGAPLPEFNVKQVRGVEGGCQ
jgi:hypothetical protein